MGKEEQRQQRKLIDDKAKSILSHGDVEQTLWIVLEHGISPFSQTAVEMRAMMCLRKGNFKEAEVFIKQAIKMNPQSPIAHKMYGDWSFLQCKYEDAERHYRNALALMPGSGEILHDLGVAIVSQGRVEESLRYFQDAIDTQPQRAEFRHHKAIMLLLAGHEKEGWDMMESRLHVPGIVGTFPESDKYWKGEDLKGKTIAVRSEQGWGDTMMFSGYFPWLLANAEKVYFFGQRQMLTFVEHYFPGVICWPNDAPPPMDFDYHVSIMCLPRLTPQEAYTAPEPFPDAGDGVGICWFGSPTHKADHLRSVPVDRFEPFATAMGRKLYCLGYGRFSEKPPFLEYIIDGCKDWLETARIVEELDLIITVDTAIAHLGGFLGVETWLLLPYVCDFRWGMTGDTTKWYPSVKLYRQPKLFDWDSVFTRVGADLRERYPSAKPSLKAIAAG